MRLTTPTRSLAMVHAIYKQEQFICLLREPTSQLLLTARKQSPFQIRCRFVCTFEVEQPEGQNVPKRP